MAAIGDDFSTFLVKFPVKSNGQFTEKQYFGAQKLVNQQGTFQRLKTKKLEFASKLVSLVVLSQVLILFLIKKVTCVWVGQSRTKRKLSLFL